MCSCCFLACKGGPQASIKESKNILSSFRDPSQNPKCIIFLEQKKIKPTFRAIKITGFIVLNENQFLVKVEHLSNIGWIHTS